MFYPPIYADLLRTLPGSSSAPVRRRPRSGRSERESAAAPRRRTAPAAFSPLLCCSVL